MNKPNMLLIFTDEQLWNTLGAYGHPTVKTPNLDQLAKNGALFRNAICPQPICTPSRASLLTGTYPHTHKCLDNMYVLTEEIPTIAELLNPHGYKCGYIGKWHIGNEVHPQRGFEEFWRGTEDNYTSIQDRDEGYFSGYHHFLMSNGFLPEEETNKGKNKSFTRDEAARMPERFGKPFYTALQAEEFFHRYHKEQFFLTINFLEPHPPYFGPLDDMYPPQGLPGNYDAVGTDAGYPDGINERIEKYTNVGYKEACKTSDREGVKNLIARYYGLVSLVDKYVGKIIDSLKKYHLMDDTIIIFTSDHGDMMGSHHLLTKRVMFEEALRVPFFVHYPNMKFSQNNYEELVNLVNVVPTLLDMAGIEIPGYIEGKSFLPVLQGQGPVQDAVFSEWHPRLKKPTSPTENIHINYDPTKIRTVRTLDWKLNVNVGAKWELYDMKNDPGETRNLINDPSKKVVVDSLLAKLKTWQQETHDPLTDIG